jgi:hypothetical protein
LTVLAHDAQIWLYHTMLHSQAPVDLDAVDDLLSQRTFVFASA